MVNAIIYDCEIERAIPPRNGERLADVDYCDGWTDHANMGVSVIGVYDYVEDSYRVFCHDNFEAFAELVNSRQWVIGFNSKTFDNRLVEAQGIVLISGDKTYDILQEMWRASGLGPIFNPRTHGGYGLDPTCAANFGLAKTGDGALAPVLWQQGRIGSVIDYCLNDVRLTRRLMDCVLAGEPLKHPKTLGELRLPIPEEVEATAQAESSLAGRTVPF